MSIYEGKKIVSALQAFNAKKVLQTDVTSLLSVALRSGGIEARHIARLHQALEREVDALPANFGVMPPLGDKRTKHITYGYMDINRDVDGAHRYDQYTPKMVSYTITKHAFMRNQTLLPLSFNSQHTAFRFIQRTSKVLDYKSDGFFDAMVYGTIMMQALSKRALTSPIPMFVPHEDGLFMGFAESMPADTYRRQHDHAARRGKRVDINQFTADPKVQPYLPMSRIVIQTFLSKDDMNPAKLALWQKLSDFMREPERQPALHKSLSCHIVGNYDVTPEMAKNIDQLQEDLRDIMSSPEWARVARYARQNGHMPARGYTDRLKLYEGTKPAVTNPAGPSAHFPG